MSCFDFFGYMPDAALWKFISINFFYSFFVESVSIDAIQTFSSALSLLDAVFDLNNKVWPCASLTDFVLKTLFSYLKLPPNDYFGRLHAGEHALVNKLYSGW